MAKYRKIDPRIWNDLKFRQLSDNGKLVFFMLLTHPHMTAVGAIRASLQGLAAEMGWTEKAFAEAFAEASQKGMVKADLKASFMWIPKFIKYNQPESPNVIKAWIKALDDLPECPLFYQLQQHIKNFTEALPKAFTEALPEGFAQPSLNQEQEQEQEQEQKKNKSVSQKKAFQKPTLEEIKKYVVEKGYNLNAEKFFNFYESKGWKVGKTPMVSWTHAVATWHNADTPKLAKQTSAISKETMEAFLNGD